MEGFTARIAELAAVVSAALAAGAPAWGAAIDTPDPQSAVRPCSRPRLRSWRHRSQLRTVFASPNDGPG